MRVAVPPVLPVDATVSYDPATRTATFKPKADLQPRTTYRATITTGARDASGNPLASPKTWRFTVG